MALVPVFEETVIGAWALVLCPEWNYVRSSQSLLTPRTRNLMSDRRIMNFFYKNIVPVGVLWWFQIYAGWSGTL